MEPSTLQDFFTETVFEVNAYKKPPKNFFIPTLAHRIREPQNIRVLRDFKVL